MTLDERIALEMKDINDMMKGIKPDYNLERIKNIMVADYTDRIQAPIKGLEESKFPTLYWENGDEITIDFIRFMFVANSSYEYYSPVTKDETDAIFEKVEKTSGEAFATYILSVVQEKGGFVKKNKHLLAVMAHLGGDDVIQAVKTKILSSNRKALVGLLGINGSINAAKVLDEIPKNYKNKQGAVVLACKKSFEIVAYKMDMSVTDLQDELIPDFGFVDLYYSFDTMKGQPLRAFLANDFKIRFIDENDKIRKSVPAQTPQELKDLFKGITKEVRGLAKQQKITLEQAMVNQRRWTKAAWEKHFMGKPLMFAFVQTLVWATFDKNNEIEQTFTVAQDGTIEDTDYEEVELDEKASIGLVHPIQLEVEQIKNWATYFGDNKTKTHFEQLNRPINLLGDIVFDDKMISKYEEKTCSNIVGRSVKKGWSRGSIVDAGAIAFFIKTFDSAGIDVIVATDGISVGYNYDCVFGKLYFVKHRSVQVAGYTYDEPRNNKDNRLISIKDVPKIIYSEVINDMEFFIN